MRLKRALAAAGVLVTAAVARAATATAKESSPLSKINHFVIVYQENHSFDNLYGGWEGVDALNNASSHSSQVNQGGAKFNCLLQNDVNLTVPPLSSNCSDSTTATPFTSHFFNNNVSVNWFAIDSYIPATATTCP